MAQTQTDFMSGDDWPIDPAGLDDDDEDVMPYEKPLDLGLVFDGLDPDEDAQDGHESHQCATGDGDGAEDDADAAEPANSAEHSVREPWQVHLAERGDDGEWRLVGEPVPDAPFSEMGLAHS